MSDETGIPDEGQATPEPHDWEKDYKALQAEYTRSQQALKDHESAWEDDQALLARLQERKPHFFEGDEEEETPADEDYEDPRDAELAELRKQLGQVTTWQQDVENERGERRFTNDLTREWGEGEIDPDIRTWIKDRTLVLGNNPDALKKAVAEWKTLERKLQGGHIEEVTQSKKAPTPPPAGKAGAKVPTLDTHEDRRQFYRQRIAEIQSGQ